MNPCCQDETNLSKPENVDGREDLVVRRCKVCGSRHFELTVDPATIGIKVE